MLGKIFTRSETLWQSCGKKNSRRNKKMKRKGIKDPPRSLQTSTQDFPAAPINSIISDNGGHCSICSQKFWRNKKRYIRKLICTLPYPSSTINFNPILNNSLWKYMSKTGRIFQNPKNWALFVQNRYSKPFKSSAFFPSIIANFHAFFNRPSLAQSSFSCFTTYSGSQSLHQHWLHYNKL